jgi:hypothetical protein
MTQIKQTAYERKNGIVYKNSRKISVVHLKAVGPSTKKFARNEHRGNKEWQSHYC